MTKIKEEPEQFDFSQIGKALLYFVILFIVVEVLISFISLGTETLMRTMGASANLRIFFGETLARVLMVLMAVFLTSLAMKKTLKDSGKGILFPFNIGWGKDLLAGLGIGAATISVVFLIELALGWLKVDNMQLSGQPFDACLRAVWLALLVNITTAASEEVLNRGFLVTSLKENWDASGALLVSAIIYGGAHVLSAGTQQTNWLHLLPMLALPGLMLAWAYLRTGNLWLVAGLHFAWNLFQYNIFNLTAQSGSDSLIGAATSLNGPQWFVGTSLGIEVGAAGIVALVIATVCIWLYTRRRKEAAK